MAGVSCSCGHAMSWHKARAGVRYGCGYPSCACSLYGVSQGDGTYAAQQPAIPAFKPDTKAAAPARAFMQANQDSGTATFMLDLAAQTLAQARLNKLSVDGYVSLARMAAGTCRICRALRTEAEQVEALAYTISGAPRKIHQGNPFLVNFMRDYHLTVEHTAEIFQCPADILRSAAHRYIDEHMAEGDAAARDDELGLVVGWRNWNLQWDSQQDKFALVPPHGNSSEKAYSYKIQATHHGDRAMALEHLANRRRDTRVDPRTLQVTVERDTCTCGLYAYTSWELFCANGYQDNTGVSGNTFPFGTINMGADGESFRASDMMLNRLVVYLGHTAISGQTVMANNGLKPWAWFTQEYDFTRLAYNALCQRLATQFEVQVDLALPIGDSGAGPLPLPLLESFYPEEQQVMVPLEEWG